VRLTETANLMYAQRADYSAEIQQGIRTLSTTITGYNPDLAKMEEQVEQMKEKAAKLKGEVLSCFAFCLCKQTGSFGEASILSLNIC
jgi:hypothetical protein